MSAADPGTCPACGADLAEGVARGLCPACLLGGITASGSSGRLSFSVPVISELADHFPNLELIELIGRGGMGAVFKARQKELDRLAALKILPGEFSDDPTFAARFTREAKTLAAMNHPNIVTIFDFGNRSGYYYILMELVEGADLSDLIEMGGTGEDEVRALVPQICEALHYAHEKGVVHRDIKPSNILVTPEARVKLTDFGLAKFAQAEFYDVSLTATSSVLGTPVYMAPEQLEEGRADHLSDVYALGVVIFQLLTGKLPHGNFKPPSQLAGTPGYLDDIVQRAMASSPEDRFQGVSEIGRRIESGGEAAGSRESRSPKARRLAMAGLAMVLLILALHFSGLFAPEEESLEDRLRKATSRGDTFWELHFRLPDISSLASLKSPDLHEAIDISRRLLIIRPEHVAARHIFLASIWHLAMLQLEDQGNGDFYPLVEAIEGNLEWFDSRIPEEILGEDDRGFYIQAWNAAARTHHRLGRHERALEIVEAHEADSRRLARAQIDAVKRGEAVNAYILPGYHQSLLFAKAEILLDLDRPIDAAEAFREGIEMLTTQFAGRRIPPSSLEVLIAGCNRVITLLGDHAPDRHDEILRHARIIDAWAARFSPEHSPAPGVRDMVDHARSLLGEPREND